MLTIQQACLFDISFGFFGVRTNLYLRATSPNSRFSFSFAASVVPNESDATANPEIAGDSGAIDKLGVVGGSEASDGSDMTTCGASKRTSFCCSASDSASVVLLALLCTLVMETFLTIKRCDCVGFPDSPLSEFRLGGAVLSGVSYV